MSGLVMDFHTVAGRLGALENELHQLRDLVSSQLVSVAPADHPYVTWMEDILGGEPIIRGTRTPVRAVVEYWKFGDAIYVEPDETHYFQAAEDDTLGFMCAVLDKELRVTVHGEQTLTLFDS